MEGYGPSTYGERFAAVYDAWPGAAALARTIPPVLAELAAGRAALELGIGTGRIALPLAALGVPVHGIDASEAMVAKLRAKPGGVHLPVTIGDFAEVDVDGTFALVYVVANTFFCLPTQEDQVRCFRNVARHLTPQGVFVLEVFVPDPNRYERGKHVSPLDVALDQVTLELSRHDPVQQRVVSQHVVLGAQGIQLYPVQIRYAWPSELDLMARLADLQLLHRWADWERRPFGPESTRHISVYRKDGPA